MKTLSPTVWIRALEPCGASGVKLRPGQVLPVCAGDARALISAGVAAAAPAPESAVRARSVPVQPRRVGTAHQKS